MAEERPRLTGTGKVVLAAIVGVPVLVLGSCGVLMAIGASSGDTGPSEVEVRNQCREWVSEQLVAPADARYSDEDVSGEGPWTVDGAVDAPNRVGVTIRMTYECTIRLDGDTWRGNAVVRE